MGGWMGNVCRQTYKQLSAADTYWPFSVFEGVENRSNFRSKKVEKFGFILILPHIHPSRLCIYMMYSTFILIMNLN